MNIQLEYHLSKTYPIKIIFSNQIVKCWHKLRVLKVTATLVLLHENGSAEKNINVNFILFFKKKNRPTFWKIAFLDF